LQKKCQPGFQEIKKSSEDRFAYEAVMAAMMDDFHDASEEEMDPWLNARAVMRIDECIM
jgi:hypothetical protein